MFRRNDKPTEGETNGERAPKIQRNANNAVTPYNSTSNRPLAHYTEGLCQERALPMRDARTFDALMKCRAAAAVVRWRKEFTQHLKKFKENEHCLWGGRDQMRAEYYNVRSTHFCQVLSWRRGSSKEREKTTVSCSNQMCRDVTSHSSI